MGWVIKYAVSLLCYFFSMFFYGLLNRLIRSNIAEIGYRAHNKKKKVNPSPRWDNLLAWSLCKKAKQNQKIVWIYFAMNILVCLCAAVSGILFLVLPLCLDIRNMIVSQLAFSLDVLCVIIVVKTILDQQFVPSEKKRHRPIPTLVKSHRKDKEVN